MCTLPPSRRQGADWRALAKLAGVVLPLLGPPPLAAAPSLQIITTVITLSVPVGAFNPGTGQAEVTLPRGLVVQVQDDNSWKLRVRATRATFVTQTGPVASKPVSDLQLRSTGDGSQFALSTAYAELGRGGHTHGWSELAFDVTFRATSADAGGLYTVSLEFDFD